MGPYSRVLKYILPQIRVPLIIVFENESMKIAIIGAGVSGLLSIRYAREYGLECVAYEITENIGGTWVYYEDVVDELHDHVPTCMYYSLRTNLPTCLMEFRDYKFQPESGTCFPGHADVLKYIQNYARDFELLPYIKFSHKVIKVSQVNGKWLVTVKNLKNNQRQTEEYDGVMVCSGHYSEPKYPELPGRDTFSGHQVHSSYYKKNHFYRDKTVLIIGKGPSGLDLCPEVADVANKVYWSHRGKRINLSCKNVNQKPRVLKIENDLIYFEDDTTASVDAIIYCTGYLYEYPFLDPTCGIENRDMIIYPLYKNFINAKYPTMCITGLLRKIIIFQLLDLQVEVFIKVLADHVKLPSTEQMLKEIDKEYEEKLRANLVSPHYYNMETREMQKYFQELYDLGNCKPFPPVIFDIHENNIKYRLADYQTYRNQVYKVIDNYTYDFHWNIKNNHATEEGKKDEVSHQ